MATTASETQVQELYIAYFGRPADPTGLAFYADSLDAGTTTVEAIATSFSSSVEAQPIIELDTDAYLEAVYQQAFGRAYNSATDGTFWADAINNGETTKELAMVQILDGAQNNDKIAVDNKVSVATTYTTEVQVESKAYAGAEAAASAKAVLTPVTFEAETVDAGNDSAVAAVAVLVPSTDSVIDPVSDNVEINGSTFTLFDNVNDIVEHTEFVPVLMWGYNPHGHDEELGQDVNDENVNEGSLDGGIPAADLVSFLVDVAGVDFFELGLIDDDGVDPVDAISKIANISLGDIQNDNQSTITITTTDGEVLTAEASLGKDYLNFMSDLLFDAEGNSRLYMSTEEDAPVLPVTPAVLTTVENNGSTIEEGFTTADNDLIVAGRTELLHGAYIDGGAGENVLQIDMKGVYAQPLELLNIQQIQVQNLPNVYSDGINSSVYPDVLEDEDDLISYSVLDLSRAIDLEKLIITEGYGTGEHVGTLTVVGIRNGVTTKLEGGFSDDVSLHYGQGIGSSVNLELNLGDTDDFNLNVAQNSNTLNLDSQGSENWLASAYFGGVLSNLNITGDAALYIQGDLNLAVVDPDEAGNESSFHAGRPATINASANTGGVDLTINNHDDVVFYGSQANDELTATNSTKVFVSALAGNNTITTDESDTVDVNTGAGNDVISSLDSVSVTINAGNGNNTITASAEMISVTTGAGNDTVSLGGLVEVGVAGNDEVDHAAPVANAAKIMIDLGAGSNLLQLGDDVVTDAEDDIFGLPGVTALQGSTISGENITLEVNKDSDLHEATLSGITSVNLSGGNLVVTAEQFIAIGAANFSVENSAFNETAELTIVVADTMNFDALGIDASTFDNSNINLSIALGTKSDEEVTFTLTAAQLHEYIAADGIDVDSESNYDDNQVVVTDAGLDFNAFGQQYDGSAAGTIASNVDITVIRDINGYERPEEDELNDSLTVNSDETPVVGDIESAYTSTVFVEGAADIEMGTLTLGENFTVDFSVLTGSMNAITIADFENITSDTAGGDNGLDVDDVPAWGEVIGNGNARVNIELTADANVGFNDHENGGFKSTGVATYVVTELNGGDSDIHVCDQTDGVEVLGLQGNYNGTVNFLNVRWGTSFLLEGDGTENFTLKSNGNPNWSNVGTVNAEYFWEGAPAVVEINNQGTATDRPIHVEAINISNAKSITINVEDADVIIAEINNTTVGYAENDQVETLTFASANDVTVQESMDQMTELSEIDASAVAGTFTLELEGDNDLSEIAMTGVDAIVLDDESELTLTDDQIAAIGIENITEADPENGDDSVLNVVISDAEFIAPELTAGINLGDIIVRETATFAATTDITDATSIVLENDAVLTLTADQFMQIDGMDITGEGTVNITGLTQAHIDAGFTLAAVTSTVVTDTMNSLTFAEDVVLVETMSLGNFAIELADGQKVTMLNEDQAHERTVTSAEGATATTVFFGFTAVVDSEVMFEGHDGDGDGNVGEVGEDEVTGLDLSNYSITLLEVEDNIVENDDGVNVEQILGHLDQDIVVEIVDTVSVIDASHRDIIVDVDTVVDGTLIFEDLNISNEISHLNITLQGGSEIDGDVDVSSDLFDNGADDAKNGELGFQQMTIVSEGETANTITGDLMADANNNLDVVINATQALTVGGVVFSSEFDGEDASAALTVNTSADVTIAAIDTSSDDVDAVTVTHTGTGALSIGIAAGDIDDEADNVDAITINGSAEATTTLVIGGAVDLSDDTLTNVDAIELVEEASLTLTVDQIVAIGEANFSSVTVGEEDDAETVNVVELSNQVFTATAFSADVELGTISMASGDNTLDPATDLTGADSIFVPEGGTLTLTADQFMQLEDFGTITTEDDDADVDTTVNITGLTQAHIDAGFTLADVDVQIGTITLAEDVNLTNDAVDTVANNDATDLSNFSVTLADGQTLGLSNDTQANGLDVNGGTDSTIVFMFDALVDEDFIDASAYDVSMLKALNIFVTGENVEDIIQDLASAVTLQIFHDPELLGFVGTTDRVVVIEPEVEVDGGLVFNDLSEDQEVATLNLTLSGGSSIVGALELPTVDSVDLVAANFLLLTINSVGDTANSMGAINALDAGAVVPANPDDAVAAIENNLLDVVINADQALSVGEIQFTSIDEEGAATLNVTGTATVAIGGLNTTDNTNAVAPVSADNDIISLEVTNASTGVLTLTLDADVNSAETLTFTGGTAGIDLVIASGEDVDLSLATLTDINSLTLVDNANAILTIAQVDAIGTANIVSVEGIAELADAGTISIGQYMGELLDAQELTDAGITINSIIFAANAGDITVDAGTSFINVGSLEIPEGTTVTLTADQYAELAGAGTITGAGTVNITELGNAHAAIDLDGVAAVNGTISLDPAEAAIVLSADGDIADLNDFAVIMTVNDQSVTFSDFAQADGRVVTEAEALTGTNVIIGFESLPLLKNSIETAGYATDEVTVLNTLVADTNVEQLLNDLASSVNVIVIVVTEDVIDTVVIDATTRAVFIRPDVEVDGELIFNDLDETVEVRTLEINLEGNASITGDIRLPTVDTGGLAADNLVAAFFDTLTINSTGTAANSIADVNATVVDAGEFENNLLNVDITADQDLSIDTIVFQSISAEDDEATATLNVEANADVTIADLNTGDDDVEALIVNHTGSGDLTVGLSSLATIDATDAITINGSATGVTTLVIEGVVNLSDDVLVNVDAIELNNGEAVTTLALTTAQALIIGLDNITAIGSDDTNEALILDLYEGELIDSTLLADPVGDLDSVTLALIVKDTDAVVTVAAGSDLSNVSSIVIPEGTTLTMTADQFESVSTGDIAGVISGAGTLSLTNFDSDNGDIDLSTVTALAGTITLDAAAPAVLVNLAADLDATNAGVDEMFEFIMTANGQSLTLSSESQADARIVDGSAVTNTTLVLGFTNADGLDIDAIIESAGFDVDDMSVLTDYLTNVGVPTVNVEQIYNDLSGDVTLTIFEEAAAIVAPTDPTAIGSTARVVVIDPDTTVTVDLAFDDLDTLHEVTSLDLTLSGNSVLEGNINLPTTLALGLDPLGDGTPYAIYFGALTINSEGTVENAIDGTISDGVVENAATENNLLNVTVNAEQDITIGGIEFSYVANSLVDATDLVDGLADTQEATLTVTGDSDVTISSLNIAGDDDITALNIVHTGTGVLTVPGLSPGINLADAVVVNATSLVLSGTGDIVLGTDIAADPAALPDPIVADRRAGVAGDDLTIIDASGLSGDLDLGTLADVDDADFTFTAGTGVTTLRLGDGDGTVAEMEMAITGNWVFDLSTAAAGSTLTFTDEVILPDMTAEAAITAGSLTINLGANGTLVIDGNVDFRTLIDADGDSTLDLTGVTTIELAEGASLQMTDAQFAAYTGTFEGAGQALFIDADNEGEFTGGMGSTDISDVRGATSIQFDEADNEATLTLKASQAAITTTVDLTPVLPLLPVVSDAGDLSAFTTVHLEVDGDADISDFVGISAGASTIDIDEGANSALTIRNEQLAEFDTNNGGPAANALEELTNAASLTVVAQVVTSFDFLTGDAVLGDSEITFALTKDVDGVVTDIVVEGLASGIANSQDNTVISVADAAVFNGLLGDAVTTAITHTGVGSEASMMDDSGLLARDLTATAGAIDTFEFIANTAAIARDVAGDTVVITGFENADGDQIDFIDLSILNTVAVTNAAADNSFVLDADENIYVIDTDGNHLGNVAGADIADFTVMANVAAFLADGVTAEGVNGEIDYFVITDDITTDAYIYEFIDTGDVTVDAVELTLIGVVHSDAVVTIADFIIA